MGRQLPLDADAFVLCSFNDAFKFEPITFAAWMQVRPTGPSMSTL